jgi:hypothetical protein
MPDDIMPPADAANPHAIRSFAQLLQVAEDGALLSDLSDEVREAMLQLQACEMQGGKPKAKITLTLGVRLDRGLVEVEGDFTVKVPKLRRGRTILHMTPNGDLSRVDPRQAQLPFRDANAGQAGQIRTVIG